MAWAWTPRRVEVISLNALAASDKLSRSRFVEARELELALPDGLEGRAESAIGRRTARLRMRTPRWRAGRSAQ